LTLFLSIFLSGCSTTINQYGKKIRIATNKEVKNCKLVVSLEGTSMQTGLMKWNGIKNARNDLINQAGESGATHLVLGEGKPHYWTTEQSFLGNAYKCKK